MPIVFLVWGDFDQLSNNPQGFVEHSMLCELSDEIARWPKCTMRRRYKNELLITSSSYHLKISIGIRGPWLRISSVIGWNYKEMKIRRININYWPKIVLFVSFLETGRAMRRKQSFYPIMVPQSETVVALCILPTRANFSHWNRQLIRSVSQMFFELIWSLYFQTPKVRSAGHSMAVGCISSSHFYPATCDAGDYDYSIGKNGQLLLI